MDPFVVFFGPLKLLLDRNDLTASIIGSIYATGDIRIPRSIIYNSEEYVIKKIKSKAFSNTKKIKTLTISEDSEIYSIEESAFFPSSLVSLSIPESVEEWSDISHPNDNIIFITISPRNKYFKMVDNLIIVIKSDPYSDVFDSLVFVRRDIRNIVIPSFIKYIKSNAFSNCFKLQSVKFYEDSQLYLIENEAFFFSAVECIMFPENLTLLESGWCENTKFLESIILSPKNKNFCYLDENKTIVLGKTDLNQDNFDVILFGSREIEEVFIPSYIKRIGSNAFLSCELLQNVQFEANSQLESIGTNAFNGTAIKEIHFPTHVKIIEDYAFAECKHLTLVEFPIDSELEIIGENVFTYSNILKINIPSSVKVIQKYAFCSCYLIKTVIFPENSKLECFLKGTFYYSSIEQITIPKQIKKIPVKAFMNCEKLEKIEFPPDSELQIIGEGAFKNSGIRHFKLPRSVQVIGDKAFYCCRFLKSIEFEEDSDLRSIGKCAFQKTSLSSLFLPEKLSELKDGWCKGIYFLDNIIVSPENPHFHYIDQTLLIGKSDPINGEFDSLLFASHSLVNLVIPSFIKYIKPYALESCDSINEVTFAEDSQLLEIGKNAFFFTEIEKITIPKNVEFLKDGWCNGMVQLTTICVSPLNKNFCYLDESKNMLLGKSDLDQDEYDILLFGSRDIEKACIPPFVKHISSGAFACCDYLKSIEFSEDSQLQSIGKNAFRETQLVSLSVPPHVKLIKRSVFYSCLNLSFIEFLADEIYIENFCFNPCFISFPNAKKITNTLNAFVYFKEPYSIFVQAYTIMD